MNNPFKSIACLLALITAGAGARELPVSPAWELIAAEAGLPATVEFSLPEGTPLHSLGRVEIAGADIRDMTVLTHEQAIRVRLNDVDGEPVYISSVTLDLGDELRSIEVIPTEVHWLNQDAEGLLRTRFMETLHTTPMVMTVVVENYSENPLELTDFRFAPAAVSTGRLLLARDFERVEGWLHFELPYAPDGTLTYDPADWDGIPFMEISFAEDSITLAPGEQVLLLASGESMTDPDLFNNRFTTEWAPWLEFRQDGQEWHHVLIRSRRAD